MRATCLVHLILLDLIIQMLIICGEVYKLEAPHYAICSSPLLLHPSYV
jgi:hypothetical protein